MTAWAAAERLEIVIAGRPVEVVSKEPRCLPEPAVGAADQADRVIPRSAGVLVPDIAVCAAFELPIIRVVASPFEGENTTFPPSDELVQEKKAESKPTPIATTPWCSSATCLARVSSTIVHGLLSH
ncbi:MAG: hypothetical protein EOS11_08265 [Mesorhizobium sp.]|uniref:hypothetical protein n=1 Tax=Mesorhizobium sp. TaxID=1871066 RepID=UPI000FE3DF28|nr:hypothetical protein [Mesorhizobium sp.]RWO33431.1 MAG: hypothetical protein EOS10_06915 [Mesorhizobium sp.]RWO46134.1 MAG: hypothetical protein EOS11_08265 [Mesorhizobium sp.]